MNTQPLGNRVHLAPVVVPPKRDSGIVVPAKYNDPRAKSQFRVLAVGPGRLTKKGRRIPIELAPGDMVLTGLYLDHQTLEDGTKVIDADQIEMAWRP